jgi:hypothetical protein
VLHRWLSAARSRPGARRILRLRNEAARAAPDIGAIESSDGERMMGWRRNRSPLALVLVSALAACGGGGDDQGSPVAWVDDQGTTTMDAAALSDRLGAYAMQGLSSAEAQGLTTMRQEERLAHDVYSIDATLNPQAIFNDLSTAEETHASAMLLLLRRYQLPDPLAGLSRGIYPDTTIQTLFTRFSLASEMGAVQALQAGAEIEELDVHDLTGQVALTDNADILMVYQHLMMASRNHLRELMKTLTQQGGSYTPQYLSQSEFDAIVDSPIETGL